MPTFSPGRISFGASSTMTSFVPPCWDTLLAMEFYLDRCSECSGSGGGLCALRMTFRASGCDRDLPGLAAQLLGQRVLLENLFELPAQGTVVEQVRLQVTQQIAHGKHGLEFRNLASDLFRLKVLHRPEA